MSSKVPIDPTISDSVGVGAKFEKGKVVFTAYFDCGFKKAGCVVRFKHTWTLTTKGTVIFADVVVSDSSHHLHLHGIKAAAKRRANKKSDGPACDLLALPSKYQELPATGNMFDAQLKPIQRFAGALATSSLPEIESGNPNACNTSFNSHRKQAEGEQHDRTPWVPDSAWQNSPKPSIDDRVQMLEDYLRDRDHAQCYENLSPEDYSKLKRRSGLNRLFGQIQLSTKFQASNMKGRMYLLTSRVHRKIAKRAARKSPGKVPVSWDASGFELDGTLVCPVIMAGEGTSGQSKLAPAPSIVGWLVVTREDKKYGVDAQTLNPC